jgi:hypothetical protein
MRAALLIAGLALAQGTDPHNGRFTTAGRTCARCHAANNPRAESSYRMAQQMSKMVDGLNAGPLKARAIDCVSCHRAGERGYVEMQEDRTRFNARQRISDNWPGNPQDGPDVRQAMARYSVALGVACSYCHSPGNWKAATKPAMQSAREMIGMVRELPKYFDLPTTGAVMNCFTCHKGAIKVPR